MRRFVLILAGLAALLALLLPAAAAASGRDVIRDCADDGSIDGDYSERELREAERDLPSDIDEYTDCREAIRGAMGGGSRGKRGGGGRAGGTGTDPALVTDSGAVADSRQDVAALGEIAKAAESGEAPRVKIDGATVTPGQASGSEVLGVAKTANDLPGPILAALILLLAAAAAGTFLLVRRHGVPAALAGRFPVLGKALPGIRRVPFARIFKR